MPQASPSKKLSKRKLLLIVASVAGLALLWLVYQLVGPSPPVLVSKETTYITEPLGRDGLPDYGAVMMEGMRAGVTPENNAAVLVWRALWPQGGGQHFQNAELLCREIGLRPMPQPGSGIQPPESQQFVEALEDWLRESGRLDHLAHDATGHYRAPPASARSSWAMSPTLEGIAANLASMTYMRPWSTDDLPPMAAWVRRHESQLDLLVEAASRSHYYSPPTNLLGDEDPMLFAASLTDVHNLRGAVRHLNSRAMHCLGEGDPEGAWRDLRASLGLGRHASSSPFLVSELVSIACVQMTLERTRDVLSRTESLSPDLAREIHAFLASYDPGWDIVKTIDQSERLACLDVVIGLSQRSEAAAQMMDLEDGFNPLNVVSVDWNVVLARMNDWYDRLAAAGRKPTMAARQAAVAKLQNDLAGISRPQPADVAGAVVGMGRRSKLVADVVAALTLPAISGVFQAEDRARADLELMRVASAIAVRRAESGAYPAKLGEVGPPLLSKTPIDTLTGKPFAYRRTGDGFLLYSLGPNGTDDGGSRIEGRWGEMLFEGRPTDRLPDPQDVETGPGLDPWVEKIPAGADDMAVRLPTLVEPWPWEAAADGRDGQDDSEGTVGSD